jgi:protocatechuate 3,4-dioxygenase, beta subunit
MKSILNILLALSLLSTLTTCKGQNTNSTKEQPSPNNVSSKLVGGGCEGCDLMYVGMPDNISSEHSSIGWTADPQKLMISGKAFRLDGKTPAPNVIIYYYHTDDKGLYSSTQQGTEAARKHGDRRGWVKTYANGHYTIKTSRPAAYPNDNIAQHIHLIIKEPDINNEYYAELYFDDDPLYLNHKKKYGKSDRSGTELLRVLLDGDIQVAEHDFVLGLNIPDYPVTINAPIASGLNIGEDQPSFIPYHAYGPDKGKQTCPVCKYGRYHGIVYFVGSNPDWNEIKAWLSFLEQESTKREKYLKAYFVYGNEKAYQKEAREKELEQLGKELQLKNLALTFVPSFTDTKTEANLNNINPDVDNTFIIYRHRTIVDKYINLKPTVENQQMISEVLDRTQGSFFDLPEPKHE